MNRDRKHIRLADWDYSSEGIYFITICCWDRQSLFGKIEDNKMILSDIGLIASQYWVQIPDHFPHVKLDEFVVMPNHIHGIIILDYSLVGPRHGTNQRALQKSNQNISQFSKPVKNSVSVIINQYKSSVKRWCNKNGFGHFQWQSRFYDQILYNEFSVNNIREYIYYNPKKWIEDEFYN
jgi:putative transposase